MPWLPLHSEQRRRGGEEREEETGPCGDSILPKHQMQKKLLIYNLVRGLIVGSYSASVRLRLTSPIHEDDTTPFLDATLASRSSGEIWSGTRDPPVVVVPWGAFLIADIDIGS
jgi:hypothetical protein